MKLLIVFALVLAAASAKFINPRDLLQSSEVEGRITNAQEAANGQFPYVAALTLITADGSRICAGSLIGPTWILTAAHCTNGASSAQVSLGSTVSTTPKVVHIVSNDNFLQHTDFNPETLANDISLIKIPYVVEDYYNIRAIALPKISSSHSLYTGEQAVASGWDTIYGFAPSHLLYVKSIITTNSVCENTFGSKFVTSNTLCSGSSNQESIGGGGPLALTSSEELIGIGSFKYISSMPGKPAGFVRVTQYLNWIKDNTGISY